MRNLIQKYKNYFEPKTIKLINIFFIISSVVCLIGLLILYIYSKYYISHLLYDASIIIFRTGIILGIFPTFFAFVIEKWKKE